MDELVTVSPKYQVVVPRAIREALGLQPGQKLLALLVESRIEYIPIKPLRSMRGFLRGMDIEAPRGEDRA